MAEDGIFLVASDGGFVVLRPQAYETEDVLQRALADHPEVLAGPTTSAGETRGLLLVKREMGVPATAGGGAVWSADHLFIDSDGVPVIVEVKRSTDTRIRREMLDYAANGVKYWPIAVLKQAVDEEAVRQGVSSDDLITRAGVSADQDEFWRIVESNLAAGRIRLVFVADALPPELVRIIEFLNEQMSLAEVLGVELRQYIGEGQVVYVPQVVGRTAAAVAAKSPGSSGQLWTRETLLDAARARRPNAELAIVERLLEHADNHGLRLGWGKGVTPGVSGWYHVAGQPAAVWNLNINSEGSATGAYMYLYLSDLAKRLPADQIEAAAHSLEGIGAFKSKIDEARAAGWNKYPSAYLKDLTGSADDIASLFKAIALLTARNGEQIDASKYD
jgi:hypothetical protein